MKRFATKCLGFVTLVLCLGDADLQAQQPADGENSYRLNAVNRRFLTEEDSISCSSGRGVFVADEPDLDGDGKAEVLITQYGNGGRVFVFEVAGNDRLEFVWASPKLHPDVFTESPGQTPRSVSTGDFDNNGMMEIHFDLGRTPTDTLRGHYIYEFTGNDDDYGSEPVLIIKPEEIDPLFGELFTGRAEEPMTIADVDGDGKTEMLFTPHATFGNLDTGNLYIMEVESGTLSGGDASIRVEYKYTAMAKALDFGEDGYTPVNTAVGDIDNDGLDEIVVLGWTNFNAGGGVGFLEISGVDTYTDGSVVAISDVSIFVVKGKVEIVDVNGSRGVLIGGMDTGQIDRKIWAIDNIVSEAFISPSDLQVIFEGVAAWGIFDIGDQDHGSGSDGFNIYASRTNEIVDIEYNGTGAISDPNSYTVNGRLGQFNLDETYDVSDGFFADIFTYPGMDIDKDGNRDIVVGYKGGCDPADVLEGQELTKNTFGLFVYEWGDSTQSIPLTLATSVEDRPGFTIITPADYHLEQNYPNPFNPETNIQFSLPVNKTVSLKIYNSRGQEVRTLVNNEALSQGTHTVLWNATDDQGNAVASGVYIYRLIFGNFSKSQTMTLVR